MRSISADPKRVRRSRSSALSRVRLLCIALPLLSLLSAQRATCAPRAFDVEELRDEGYVDERQERSFGSFSHTLTALGPGAVLHGLGHWRMGDEGGGWALLGAELVGLTALTSVALLQRDASHRSTISELGVSTLSHLGWGLTIGSWVLDVIGAYQGGLTFIQEREQDRYAHLSLGYRYVEDPGASLTHHIIARHDVKRGRFKLFTELNLESKGQLVGVRQDLSFRLTPRAERASFELSLGLKGRRWDWVESDTTQLSLLPYLSWELPLRGVARGLTHTTIYQRAGYGWEGYQSPRAERIEARGDPDALTLSERVTAGIHHSRGVLLLETGLRLKLYQDATLSIGYLQDPTSDIERSAWGASIWGLNELGLISNEGLWSGELVIRQTPLIDFIVEAQLGARWSTWLTIRYTLGRRET